MEVHLAVVLEAADTGADIVRGEAALRCVEELLQHNNEVLLVDLGGDTAVAGEVLGVVHAAVALVHRHCGVGRVAEEALEVVKPELDGLGNEERGLSREELREARQRRRHVGVGVVHHVRVALGVLLGLVHEVHEGTALRVLLVLEEVVHEVEVLRHRVLHVESELHVRGVEEQHERRQQQEDTEDNAAARWVLQNVRRVVLAHKCAEHNADAFEVAVAQHLVHLLSGVTVGQARAQVGVGLVVHGQRHVLVAVAVARTYVTARRVLWGPALRTQTVHRDDRDEGSELQQQVRADGDGAVDAEGTHGGHRCHGTHGEGKHLAGAGHDHGAADLAERVPHEHLDLLLREVVLLVLVQVQLGLVPVGAADDEHVVDADSQEQEGDDVRDDHRERDTGEAAQTDRYNQTAHYDDDAAEGHEGLAVHTVEVAQGTRDVDEHDDVRDDDIGNGSRGLLVERILHAALGHVRHVHVRAALVVLLEGVHEDLLLPRHGSVDVRCVDLVVEQQRDHGGAGVEDVVFVGVVADPLVAEDGVVRNRNADLGEALLVHAVVAARDPRGHAAVERTLRLVDLDGVVLEVARGAGHEAALARRRAPAEGVEGVVGAGHCHGLDAVQVRVELVDNLVARRRVVARLRRQDNLLGAVEGVEGVVVEFLLAPCLGGWLDPQVRGVLLDVELGNADAAESHYDEGRDKHDVAVLGAEGAVVLETATD
eukprot:PhM_4_TR15939/c0_g1_i3/m.273